MNLFDLSGRTALVTGAARGIGRAIAVGLARAGADVVVHGRNRESLAPVCGEIAQLGRKADVWVYDLADPERIPAAVKELPAIDILVNNAGIIHRAPAVRQKYADWREVHAVNLDSVFQLTARVGSGMLDRGRGKVIMIASLLTFQGGLNVAGYASSKHAIGGLTKALANEWTAGNVQVNAIAPGYVDTDNTEPLRADPQRERSIRERIPAGRWGRPDDLVGAAVFLAAPASDYVAGHVLTVDGGWLAR